MSTLSFKEKRSLEVLFEMGSGYVLDFSNRTFADFFADTLGIEIYTPEYETRGDSKANRLRAFWETEPDHLVARILTGLVELAADIGRATREQISGAEKIALRLKANAPVQDLEAITPNQVGHDFDVLAKSVRESIEANEPEAGLDRLHTFVTTYVRVMCEQEGLAANPKTPLHGLWLRRSPRMVHLCSLEMVHCLDVQVRD